ncbi:MAG: LacI family DNA-binding transcriptional regulator [Verrucomicrobiota bacterium JB024]|nr:LacI family DNA-binding transcriptional regulator [Verrucomicrobiota bacterium JB024]
MKRRVTLKQVAERAGVHLSTVSLALRNYSRISQQKREEIQALAKEMGYVPDAGLSALSSYRNAVRPQDVRSGLAYLTDMGPQVPFGKMVYENASQRASELGYNLIEYNLGRLDISMERLQSIWWNQGLRGVIIGPFTRQTRLSGEWDRWPVVAIGYSVEEPHFNRASTHHFQNTLIHLEELQARGYRRVGFCLPDSLDKRTDGQKYGAYLLYAQRNGLKHVPPYTREQAKADEIDEWVRRHRLDAVIGHPPHYEALLEKGWKVPEQIGFSQWIVHHDDKKNKDLAGFDETFEHLSANTIDFLVSLIHKQVCGVLTPPRFYMESGSFRDGLSVRPRA